MIKSSSLKVTEFPLKPNDRKMEMRGIDPRTSRMLSERSTI